MITTKPVWAGMMLAAVLCVVSGCNHPEPASRSRPSALAPTAEEVPADAAAPFTYDMRTDHAHVTLSLPMVLASEGDLHARLYSEGVGDLKAFAEGAESERVEIQDTSAGQPPYSRSLDWTLAGQTSKLISLKRTEYESAGGAHPNSVFGGMLWDRALKKPLTLGALLKSPSAVAEIDSSLCEGLKTARLARLKQMGAQAATALKCPNARDLPFVLAPSVRDGKAGGLTFLMAPYAVGSYAEGAYEVTVPTPVFAANLTSAYADEFAEPIIR